MIELAVHEFPLILPLLAGIGQKVLPFAICQGINPGRVFVDQRTDPQTALIWSPVGYYFLAGEPSQAVSIEDVSQVLTEIFIPVSQVTGETGFILVTSDPNWKEYLPALLPGREVIEIYRRPFVLDLARFNVQGNWRERIPPGFHLEPVNSEFLDQVGVLASWTSEADFLSNGIGFVLLCGKEIASACHSIFVSHESVEIDVHTAEEFRRRGFAVITASALIEACLQRGKHPNYECFWENEPSVALAGKLGFEALPDYPVYYWEESGENCSP